MIIGILIGFVLGVAATAAAAVWLWLRLSGADWERAATRYRAGQRVAPVAADEVPAGQDGSRERYPVAAEKDQWLA